MRIAPCQERSKRHVADHSEPCVESIGPAPEVVVGDVGELADLISSP